MIAAGDGLASLLIPAVSAIILAAGASVFSRRKYGAEIRALNVNSDGVAVTSMTQALAAQQTYIEALADRLTRAELASTRALAAEAQCRMQLTEMQVRFASIEAQLLDLQRADVHNNNFTPEEPPK